MFYYISIYPHLFGVTMPDTPQPNQSPKRRRGGQLGNQNARRYARPAPDADSAPAPASPELIAGFHPPDPASQIDLQIYEQMDALRVLVSVLKQNLKTAIPFGLLMKYTRLIDMLTLSLSRLARLREKALPRLRPDNVPQATSQAVLTELSHYAETH